MTSNLEHVLGQPGTGVVFVGSDGICIVVDLEEESPFDFKVAFRLPDKDAVPCDYNGRSLLVFFHAPRDTRYVRVMDAEHCISEPGFNTRATRIYKMEIPKHWNQCHLFKFWGPDRVVFVKESNHLALYDFKQEIFLFDQECSGGADILAIDTTDPDVLFTVSADSTFGVWDASGFIAGSSLKPLTVRITVNVLLVHINVTPDVLFFEALAAGDDYASSWRQWFHSRDKEPAPPRPQEFQDKLFAVAADYGVFMFSLRRLLNP